VDQQQSISQVGYRAEFFHDQSPDGRLWVSQANMGDSRATLALVGFDPPSAETLAAPGPQTRLVFGGDGIYVEPRH
jgi:hypothetical protein